MEHLLLAGWLALMPRTAFADEAMGRAWIWEPPLSQSPAVVVVVALIAVFAPVVMLFASAFLLWLLLVAPLSLLPERVSEVVPWASVHRRHPEVVAKAVS